MIPIIGHQRICEYLSRAVDGGSFPSGYLFVGPEHVGKRTLAEWFVERIGAGECFRYIPKEQWREREDEHVLDADGVREMLGQIVQSPLSGYWKVVLINGAEFLHEMVANALLKSLEEPPPQTLFILTAKSAGGVLPTITSRCTVIQCLPVPCKEITAGLMTAGLHDAERRAQRAYGCPGRAIRLSDEDGVRSVRMSELFDKSLAEQLLAEMPDEAINDYEEYFHQRIGSSILSQQYALYVILKDILRESVYHPHKERPLERIIAYRAV